MWQTQAQAFTLNGYSPEKVVLLLESELDAILVQQLAENLCSCMAIGGAGKHPDAQVRSMDISTQISRSDFADTL